LLEWTEIQRRREQIQRERERQKGWKREEEDGGRLNREADKAAHAVCAKAGFFSPSSTL